MKSTMIIAALAYAMFGMSIASPVGDLGLDTRQNEPTGDGDCDGNNDCCYSSEAACFRQLGTISGNIYCGLHKFCATDYNIPRTKCNADCCSISTGLGRGCPGK